MIIIMTAGFVSLFSGLSCETQASVQFGFWACVTPKQTETPFRFR